MPQFTAAQLQGIAQTLNDISVAIGQVRLSAIHAGAPLNDPQIVNLLGLNLSLASAASTFARQAAEVTLADTAQALATITRATGQAKTALNHIKTLDTAINIASSVLVLASSVFTGDPLQILNAADGVYAAGAAAAAPDTTPSAGS